MNINETPLIHNINVGIVQTDTIYYNVQGISDKKLDIKRLQIWVFDKDHRIIHTTADPQFDKETYNKLDNTINNNFEITLEENNVANKDTWKHIVNDAFRKIETKRTTLVNNTLMYIESKPLYYGDNFNDIYGVLLILIPYEIIDKHIELFDKKYTKIESGKLIIYKPSKTIRDEIENMKNVKYIKISTYFQRCLCCMNKIIHTKNNITINRNNIDRNTCIKTGIPYELDLNRFQIWLFDKDKMCIHATHDDLLEHYPLEYYLGKHLDTLNFYDISIWKWAYNNAFNLKKVKRSILYKREIMYIEAKPLFYNDIYLYGVLIILVPYLTKNI
jgi:hypothetical protein